MYLFRPSDLAESESIDFFFQPNHKTEIPPPEFNQLKRTKAKISDAYQNQDKSDLLSESSVLSRNIVVHHTYLVLILIRNIFPIAFGYQDCISLEAYHQRSISPKPKLPRMEG